ncbi:TetR/AcrR family transcriptional regulator [Nocardia arthritidis]|uniref:TetR family transcriptional regulator n=1 Tax=Nocardia arthritidis TaxID=228602 RepID=A0A6G9YBL4_9NOCA|nr:TetR family transcriptional regulator [Nocardia arthritidis]QIS10592.1 TetR family transcriptional regulator [Nocardia arthritidis]
MGERTTTGERKRSGKQRLSRTGILDAAQQIIDDLGVPGLTMRSLAARLDADPTAVYRHFRNKDALLAALADAALAEVIDHTAGEGEWRESLRTIADRLRSLVRRRPELVAIITGAPITSATLTATAAILRLLRTAGLSAADAERGFSAVLSYVLGFGMLEANPPCAADTPAEGSADEAAALRIWLPETHSRDAQFVAGFDLILDSLTARIAPHYTA